MELIGSVRRDVTLADTRQVVEQPIARKRLRIKANRPDAVHVAIELGFRVVFECVHANLLVQPPMQWRGGQPRHVSDQQDRSHQD
jgi:hypothetical protein